MIRSVQFFLGLVFLFLSQVSNADKALLDRKEVQLFVNKMVHQYHFDRRQLTQILKDAQFQPKIIESMEKPYEKKTWDIYRALFLTEQRVQGGIEFWKKNQNVLNDIEKKYGVPPEIIVAILGVETLYGQQQGNYRVLDALTTLAFYYPKRSEFFTKELGEFLLLCREQKVAANKYLGSYAGAMGKPQFMPSSYRFYAVDFNGKGTRDLMNNDHDVVASIANYFHKHGWKSKQAIVEPVSVNGIRYKSLATNSRIPDYSLKDLLEAGVKPVDSSANAALKVGLIELTSPNGQEYWMAHPNFYVITHYNTSPQYALVVYLLSQQLHQQWVNKQIGKGSIYGVN
jgi:membrane-bound lytic murein transglycosylase B